MLMLMKSLATVQTNLTTETAKKTQLLNYSATHPDKVTKNIRSGMIFHIYSDTSYTSEPEAHSRAGEYFSLYQNPKNQ